MILAILLFISGIAISVVAEYYSIMGLMAIFSAAPIPIAVMGIALGVGKLVQATWLKAYWTRLPTTMRLYGVLSVSILMLITTLGCFGFLSKAHSDQTLVSGDSQAKVAIYDEKIKTAKDNIDANRKAIKQMDDAVDQVMGRSNDEKGADKAVAIRRSQSKERVRLLGEIENEQRNVARLSEERAPYAAEFRKMESEVGPIKYIAAFIYGDNPDANVLERAVTWVIVLIVIVFDPLAVVMLLASQMTWQWRKEGPADSSEYVASGSGPTIDELIEQEEQAIDSDEGSPKTPAYLEQPFAHFGNTKPMPAPVNEPEPKLETTPFDVVDNGPNWTLVAENNVPVIDTTEVERLSNELNEAQSNVYELANYVQNLQQDYASVSDLHQKSMSREAELIEELASLKEQLENTIVEEEDNVRPFTEEEIMSFDDGVDESAFLERFQENLDSGHQKNQDIFKIDPGFVYQPATPTVEERLASGQAVSITEMPQEFRDMIRLGIESGELSVNGADISEPAYQADDGPLTDDQIEQIKDSVNLEVQKDSASEAYVAPISQPEQPILAVGVDVADRPGDYITDPVANLFTKREPKTDFGNTFHDNPERGDFCMRTDFRPTKLFKWNGAKWMQVSKDSTDIYAFNDAYIQFLADQVLSGVYSWDDLSQTEVDQVQTLIGGRRG